jgi:hypothetical protein
MTTVKVPNDWHALRSAVGRILGGCGFTFEIEKVFQTMHARVEIDVYAQESVKDTK